MNFVNDSNELRCLKIPFTDRLVLGAGEQCLDASLGVRVQLEAVYGACVKICDGLFIESSSRSSLNGRKTV